MNSTEPLPRNYSLVAPRSKHPHHWAYQARDEGERDSDAPVADWRNAGRQYKRAVDWLDSRDGGWWRRASATKCVGASLQKHLLRAVCGVHAPDLKAFFCEMPITTPFPSARHAGFRRACKTWAEIIKEKKREAQKTRRR